MSKIKSNSMFRELSRMMRLINKADEVFIEAYCDGQSHTQMIKSPEMDYNSTTNSMGIITLDGYGDYVLNLNGLKEIEDWYDDRFDYHLYFDQDKYIILTNEW